MTPTSLIRITPMLALLLLVAPRAHAAPADSLALDFPISPASPVRSYALRLKPGQDLRVELLRFARAKQLRAGYIATGAGSVTRSALRYANQSGTSVRDGHFEIVALTGTLAADGAHLHASFADSTGACFGGHLMDGTRIYTTAEVVIGELEKVRFDREPDSTTTYRELLPRGR